MSDTTFLGQMAAMLMQQITDMHGEDADIRMIAIALEVDGGDHTTFMWNFSDDRPWVQAAFVDEVATQIDRRATESSESGEE